MRQYLPFCRGFACGQILSQDVVKPPLARSCRSIVSLKPSPHPRPNGRGQPPCHAASLRSWHNEPLGSFSSPIFIALHHVINGTIPVNNSDLYPDFLAHLIGDLCILGSALTFHDCYLPARAPFRAKQILQPARDGTFGPRLALPPWATEAPRQFSSQGCITPARRPRAAPECFLLTPSKRPSLTLQHTMNIAAMKVLHSPNGGSSVLTVCSGHTRHLRRRVRAQAQ